MRYVRETGLFSKEAIRRKFSAMETKFEVQQGAISAIISDSELIELKNGNTTMYNRMAAARMDLDSLDMRFSRQESAFDAQQGAITTLQSESAQYRTGIDGLTVDLSRLTTKINSEYTNTVDMRAEISASVSGLTSRVSAIETSLTSDYATTASVNSAITQTTSSITQNIESLRNTVTRDYVTTEAMRTAINTSAGNITQTVASTYARISSVNSIESNVNALNRETVKNVKVEYAKNSSPTDPPTSGWSTATPEWENGKHIWMRVSSLINGEWVYNNVSCVTGPAGPASYIHIKYSDDGGKTFTGHNGDDAGAWMGMYADTNKDIPTSLVTHIIFKNKKRLKLRRLEEDAYPLLYRSLTVLYTWSRTKGLPGDAGAPGVQGIGIVESVPEYYLSTSNIRCAGGEWSTAMQEYVGGRYYWTRLKTIYTDGSIRYSEPEIYSIYNQLYFRVADLEEWSEISQRTQTKNSISDFVASTQTFMEVANRAELFTQSTAPREPRVGDTWIDTGNGNLVKRWDGTRWVDIRDAGTTDLLRIVGSPQGYSGATLLQRINSAEQKITDSSIISTVQQANVFVSENQARQISITQAKSEIAQWYNSIEISAEKIQFTSAEAAFGRNLAVVDEHVARSVNIGSDVLYPSGSAKFTISGGYLYTASSRACITGLKPNIFKNGDTIYISFTAKKSNGNALTLKFVVYFYNASKTAIANCSTSFTISSTSDAAFSQTWQLSNSNINGAAYYSIALEPSGSQVYPSIKLLRMYLQSDSTVIKDGCITTGKIATDAIKSINYSGSTSASAGETYSSAGSFFDLTSGMIRSKNFVIDNAGSAYFKGKITATSGTIGGVNINGSAIYSGSKSGYGNANAGFYMNSSGQFDIGNGTTYIRHSNGAISIAATSISIGGTAIQKDAEKTATNYLSWTSGDGLIVKNMSGTSYNVQIKSNAICMRDASGNALNEITASAYKIYTMSGSTRKIGMEISASEVKLYDPANQVPYVLINSSGLNADKGSIGKIHFRTSDAFRVSGDYMIQVGSGTHALDVGPVSDKTVWEENMILKSSSLYIDYYGNLVANSIDAPKLRTSNADNYNNASSVFAFLSNTGYIQKGFTLSSLKSSVLSWVDAAGYSKSGGSSVTQADVISWVTNAGFTKTVKNDVLTWVQSAGYTKVDRTNVLSWVTGSNSSTDTTSVRYNVVEWVCVSSKLQQKVFQWCDGRYMPSFDPAG